MQQFSTKWLLRYASYPSAANSCYRINPTSWTADFQNMVGGRITHAMHTIHTCTCSVLWVRVPPGTVHSSV